MLKRIKIIDEKIKQVLIMSEKSNEMWAIENGYSKTLFDVEEGYNGNWYLQGYAPIKPKPTIAEQNESIRQTRESQFTQFADPLEYDYNESYARYGADDERTVASKGLWLAKKDEIRNDNPYLLDNN